jgi:dTDP-4-dehydrorhamnose reductase
MTSRIEKNSAIAWGTYHYCGQGITTWHEFAENILAMAASQASIRITRVQPITTDQYPTKAQRPAFSVLDCSRITKRFDILPAPWQQSLKETIDRIFSGCY